MDTVTLQYHLESLRAADKAFDAERDRRHEQRFQGQEQALTIALASIKERVEKSDQAYTLRFEQVNEWRRTYSDLVTGTMSRNEIEQRFMALDSKLDAKLDPIIKFVAERQGGTTRNHATLTYILSAVGVLGTLVGIAGTLAAAVIFIMTRTQ